MQDLLKVIEQIRLSIEAHRGRLHSNEMLTRYALIDPLLRALGWDTEAPDQVEPEFPTQKGRPDYALFHNGQPFLHIEAKSLGSDLREARDDGFKYCWQNKVPFYVITDGNIWELYDLREMGGKQIFRVCLTEDNIGDTIRHLLALWRPAMPAVQPSLPPLIEPVPRPYPSPQRPKSFLSLKELRSQVRSGQKPPERAILADGSVQTLNSWKDLLFAVARFSLPHLRQRSQLPLRGHRGKGFLIGRSENMRSPKKLDDHFFVETHDSARGCVRRACQILEAAGIDLENVRVELKE